MGLISSGVGTREALADKRSRFTVGNAAFYAGSSRYQSPEFPSLLPFRLVNTADNSGKMRRLREGFLTDSRTGFGAVAPAAVFEFFARIERTQARCAQTFWPITDRFLRRPSS